MSHGRKPADKRHNLLMRMSYKWIKQYEPELWQRFQRIAEIEFPRREPGRPKKEKHVELAGG